MHADMAKLKRAGLSEARVFGRRDFDPKSARPVLEYPTADGSWWSPDYPTWMFRDGDCKVLAKAIAKYGVREAPVRPAWLDYTKVLFASTGEPIELGEANDYVLNDGTVFPGYEVLSGIVPATPVMYLLRRYEGKVDWTDDGKLRVRAYHAGSIVGVICCIPTWRVTLREGPTDG